MKDHLKSMKRSPARNQALVSREIGFVSLRFTFRFTPVSASRCEEKISILRLGCLPSAELRCSGTPSSPQCSCCFYLVEALKRGFLKAIHAQLVTREHVQFLDSPPQRPYSVIG